MARLDSKVVVVTGATGGLGRAAVAGLHREGAIVIATDVHESASDQAPGAVYRKLNVSQAQEWTDLATWIAQEHGRVDGLINNAGVAVRTRLDDVQLDDLDRVFAVNVKGPLLGIQAMSQLMPSGSSIVNVSSVAGLNAHYPIAYTVSKWAVRGLSKVASMELGARGIRVNTIFPGFIETPIKAAATPAYRQANIQATPLGRTGTPDEVASLFVYLMSDESSYISGAEIVVDGGLASHGGAKQLSDALQAEAAAVQNSH